MAVAARWREMLPLFDTIAKQREEIKSVRDQLKTVNAEVAKAHETTQEALHAAELVTPRLRRTQADLEKAQGRILELERDIVVRAEEHRSQMSGKNEEVKRLHTQLQALKAKVRHTHVSSTLYCA